MVQSTLDCNQQWYDFLASTNNEMSNICHRLNVRLEDRPPHLDDVDAIPRLSAIAENYLKPDSDKAGYRHRYLDKKYDSADQHVKVVARRLTAALFYFERFPMNIDGTTVGALHCRLSVNAAESFKQLLRAEPQFRLSYYDPAKGRPTVPLPTAFDLDTFSSLVSFKIIAERLTIQMKLPKWPVWEPISGFSSS